MSRCSTTEQPRFCTHQCHKYHFYKFHLAVTASSFVCLPNPSPSTLEATRLAQFLHLTHFASFTTPYPLFYHFPSLLRHQEKEDNSYRSWQFYRIPGFRTAVLDLPFTHTPHFRTSTRHPSPVTPFWAARVCLLASSTPSSVSPRTGAAAGRWDPTRCRSGSA